jgi:hypothetical protein
MTTREKEIVDALAARILALEAALRERVVWYERQLGTDEATAKKVAEREVARALAHGQAKEEATPNDLGLAKDEDGQWR